MFCTSLCGANAETQPPAYALDVRRARDSKFRENLRKALSKKDGGGQNRQERLVTLRHHCRVQCCRAFRWKASALGHSNGTNLDGLCFCEEHRKAWGLTWIPVLQLTSTEHIGNLIAMA